MPPNKAIFNLTKKVSIGCVAIRSSLIPSAPLAIREKLYLSIATSNGQIKISIISFRNGAHKTHPIIIASIHLISRCLNSTKWSINGAFVSSILLVNLFFFMEQSHLFF